MFYEFQPDVWILDGNIIKFKTMPILPKTVVIKLKGGGLWVHSPITLTPERRKLISNLGDGDVKYLIAPNKYHYQSVDDWKTAFINAQLWVSPGCPKKLPKINYDHVIDPKRDDYPWSDEISQVMMGGNPFLDEIFFLHKASKTLIITDWLHRQDPSRETLFWLYVKRGLGMMLPQGGIPRHIKGTLTSKTLGKESMDKVLSWDFENVIVGHGSSVEGDGHGYVEQMFGWLYP